MIKFLNNIFNLNPLKNCYDIIKYTDIDNDIDNNDENNKRLNDFKYDNYNPPFYWNNNQYNTILKKRKKKKYKNKNRTENENIKEYENEKNENIKENENRTENENIKENEIGDLNNSDNDSDIYDKISDIEDIKDD